MGLFKIDTPQYVQKIIDVFEKKDKEVYLVGGCIRDTLLNLPIKDYDLTTSVSFKDLKDMFNGFNVIEGMGEKHNTLSINIDNHIVEITTFKGDSIIEDLSHRDITINAMAYSKDKGLIDPYYGQIDLENKIIRPVISAKNRIYEDPLRILRILRFKALYNFQILEEDKKTINRLAYKLNDVSVERIFSELKQILLGDNIKEILLDYRDVFKIIIPELEACFYFNQKSKYHLHDIYTHIVNVVSYTQKDEVTRLAALLHDIGKPKCYTEEIRDGNIIGHFYGHYDVGSKMSEEILKRLKSSNKVIEEVKYLIYYHDLEIGENKKSVNKFLLKTPNNSFELFNKLLDLKEADFKDHINVEPTNYNKIREIALDIINNSKCLTVLDLKLNGNDLIELGYKGKEIGEILKLLLKEVVDEKINNTKEELLNYVLINGKKKD